MDGAGWRRNAGGICAQTAILTLVVRCEASYNYELLGRREKVASIQFEMSCLAHKYKCNPIWIIYKTVSVFLDYCAVPTLQSYDGVS